ncbi:MAG: amidase [Planctomycetales bacterium]
MDDPLDAFCHDTHVELTGAENGSLRGLTFAVKDVFDIEGHRTGSGNPDWLRTHPPASATSSAVQRVLNGGAGMVGKTHTDELTYSLNGNNHHYGTPRNPRAPRRIPGGSSSGSAAATAGNLVDFALGTDCGGSVRLPASYCGIFGFRPSHGRIPMDGVMPLAASFDTVGWFARDSRTLEKVGRVLLADDQPAAMPRRVFMASDAFGIVDEEVTRALQPAVQAISAALDESEDITVAPEGLLDWMQLFRALQGHEVWREHAAWIREVQPDFGPDIRARFEWASSLDPNEQPSYRERREQIAARLDELLDVDTVLCVPTVSGIAPLAGTAPGELEQFRAAAMSLLCIAGLARLPQLSLPIAELKGCPLGISIIGRRGTDTQLLAFASARFL